MRLVLLSLVTGLIMVSATGFAETVTISGIRADNSQNYLLKRIMAKVGNRLLRALVVDSEGRETQLYITAEDALEIKRGLWVIRPGVYKMAI